MSNPIERLRNEAQYDREHGCEQVATLLDEAAQEIENARGWARAWKGFIKRESKMAICAWCGDKHPKSVIAEHIFECVKHPVGELAREYADKFAETERERDEIERRNDDLISQAEASKQRIAALTSVAVLALKYRHSVIMTPEHYAAERQLGADLEAAGFVQLVKEPDAAH